MSVKVLANPTQLAGSPGLSGDCGDRHVRWTDGGERVYTALSGIAVDTLVFSGGGRVNKLVVLTSFQSGRPVSVYDGNIATSGGPHLGSGHLMLGTIPAVWREGASGVINDLSAPGSVINVQAPFRSGLIVAPGAAGSGTVGFSIIYTPDPVSAASGSTLI